MAKPKVSPKISPNTLENSIRVELEAAGDRSAMTTREKKKNYAEVLSRKLAQRFADALRPNFETILPDADGRGQESKARSSKGYKKLDVNYSTLELGLGLGVSIKTINFVDGKSGRYTKNYTRADAELRAEATDYHDRQPYAVMVAVIFLPLDSCDDGTNDSVAQTSLPARHQQKSLSNGPAPPAFYRSGFFPRDRADRDCARPHPGRRIAASDVARIRPM